MRFEVQNVVAMPQILEPGVLYVSREFETAHHLFAHVDAGTVRTPLSPVEWQVFETPARGDDASFDWKLAIPL